MNTKDVYILGLTCLGGHDSCAALLKNGEIIAAAEEERFTRIKFDRSFPKNSISWCLKSAGIGIDQISHAGFFWLPWSGILKRGLYMMRGFPNSFQKTSGKGSIFKDLLYVEKTLREETGFQGSFHYLNHHLTHAASVFYSSGFEKAAIVSVDGTGEKITCWIGEGDGISLKEYKTIIWPHSIGLLYSTATQYLGFKVFSDEYKVMGLSAYGKPTHTADFRKILKSTKYGDFELDASYFDYIYYKEPMYSKKWVEKFGPARRESDEIEKRHMDMASSLQTRLEEVLRDICMYVLNKRGSGPLCLTGGVALNSLAVGKIADLGIADVYTSPVSDDSGCALGAAYYIYHNILGHTRKKPLAHAYLGSGFTKKEIEQALKKAELYYQQIDNPQRQAARLISEGHVVGWYQGNSEIGQRALGNRSILADPRDKKMKDHVNMMVKYREFFRPFAPAILEEYQTEYFQWSKPVPYMTEVHVIRREKRKIIPAVTHVDGTGRLQTVTKKTNRVFWDLINEFRSITGVPVVLNTSFNIKGEPIVDSPSDAIRTFLNSGIDDLFLHNYWVSKKLLKKNQYAG